MARRLPSVLPPMSVDEALEATKLYSVAGMLTSDAALVNTRPFRSPHHTVSTAALVGVGTVPKPGEVSLAHHGVLFLSKRLRLLRRFPSVTSHAWLRRN
jgi:magnesium chelatase family protein